ncbi:hypothetical protein GCM10020219_066280 [Nonomuraea dietziae]
MASEAIGHADGDGDSGSARSPRADVRHRASRDGPRGCVLSTRALAVPPALVRVHAARTRRSCAPTLFTDFDRLCSRRALAFACRSQIKGRVGRLVADTERLQGELAVAPSISVPRGRSPVFRLLA